MVKSSHTWSAERSSKQIRSDFQSVSKATNLAWSCAKKAPLFLRKPKYIGSGKQRKRATMTGRNGKEVPVPQRANRCVRTAVFKTLLSGAAASVNELLKAEGASFKTEVQGEASVAASLPKLSPSAEIMLEHALSTYTQTIFDVATRIKDSMNLHNKVSVGCMQAACEIVNRSVFSASSMQPGVVIIDAPSRKSKSKKASADAGEGEAKKEDGEN
jgi:hypothetical protein